MYMRRLIGLTFIMLIVAFAPLPSSQAATSPRGMHFGKPATPAEIAGWNIDVEPSGAGLPAGSGTAEQGTALFAADCAACHGAEGQGMKVPGHGMFPRLVGGTGTLAGNAPVKTVGSFWPYATGVFDYIRRAMPFNHPESLTSQQVYALTAFILWKNGIVGKNDPMNAQTLPRVKMPNADGFFTRPKPHD